LVVVTPLLASVCGESRVESGEFAEALSSREFRTQFGESSAFMIEGETAGEGVSVGALE